MIYIKQLALICNIFVNVAFSLYEDQIGKFDWRQQYVGKVKVARISGEATSLSHRRLFVATENNVLALINTENGEILWRQIFNRRGKIDDLLLRTDDVSVIYGDRSKVLHNFDSIGGTLNWEWHSGVEDCHENFKLSEMGGNVIVVMACNRIFAVDSSGSLQWKLTFPNAKNIVYYKYPAVVVKSKELVVVAEKDIADLHKYFIYRINVKTGSIIQQQVVQLEPHLNKFVVIRDQLIMFSSNNGVTFGINILNDSSSLMPLTLGIDGVSQLIDINPGTFAVTDKNNKCLVYTLTKDGVLEKRASIMDNVKNILSVSLTNFGKTQYAVLVTQHEKGRRLIKWFDLTNDREIAPEGQFIMDSSEIHDVEGVLPVAFSKGNSPDILYRTIILGTDHAIAAFQNSDKPLWIRQEILSEIIAVEMVDLPLSESQASVESEFSTAGQNFVSMFVRRLTTQAKQVQRGFLRLVNESLILMGALGTTASPSDWLTILKTASSPASFRDVPFERDYFNLHKVIVVVTSIGKVFGLDNRNGKILWQFYDANISPFSGASEKRFQLYVQRTTAHVPYPAQCALIGKHKLTGEGYMVLFDPVNGQIKQSIEMKRFVRQTILLPVTSDDELFGIGILTDGDEVLFYPSNIKEPLAKWLKTKPVFFFNVDSQNGSTNGYRLNKLKSGVDYSTTTNALVYEAENVWRFTLPLGKNGKIVDVKMKRLYEHLHSQGRVLGDRSVLYKYSNPNLVAAVVEKPDEDEKSSTYSIYLFDAITGTVVSSLAHHRVGPPFHMVHCENWLVYTFYNEKARRTEFTVLELYEGKHQTDPDKFSSFIARPSPIAVRQSYIFPQGVSALAVTNTEKGITSRHLIVALPFGGLLELHKAFLDPRRVLNPTPEEREEGLIPYIPDLPIATEHLINYNQSVFNIRGIHTSSAGLESTSLVLAYGLDLFYTRVHPSATFDILKDDFDHWFISLMLLGLVLASVVTKKIAKLRDLKLAWR